MIELVSTIIIILCQTTWLRWLTLLLLTECSSHSTGTLDLFISSDLVLVLQWFFLHWDFLTILLPQFPLILLYIFLHQTTLLRWLTFLLSTECDFHNSALLDLSISSDLLFVLQLFSLHSEVLIILFSQFPLIFVLTQNEMPLSIAKLVTILVLI